MTRSTHRSPVRTGHVVTSLAVVLVSLLTAAPAGATPNALGATTPGCMAPSTATLDVVAAGGGTWTTTMTAANIQLDFAFLGGFYRVVYTLAAGSQTGTIGTSGSGYPLTQNLKLLAQGYTSTGGCSFPATPQCTFTDTFTGLTGNLTGGGITGEVITTGSTLTWSSTTGTRVKGFPCTGAWATSVVNGTASTTLALTK